MTGLTSLLGGGGGLFPVERGEHISFSPPWKSGGGGGGGWKGGGKGTQSALSALTLLAFLFFLNLLQSCLKEQLASQSPLVIMMTTQTTSTTTEGTKRHKRSPSPANQGNMNVKGESNYLNETLEPDDIVFLSGDYSLMIRGDRQERGDGWIIP